MVKTKKKELLDECLKQQNKLAQTAKNAMLQAQESANEQKGTMGDKFESFREQCQIDRDMYARQYEEALKVLNVINKIDPEKNNEAAALGAIVITDTQQFFISASLGTIKMDDQVFVAISTSSPMFQAMAGKKKSESFSFRDKKFLIKEIS
jgi:hypothetical protein